MIFITRPLTILSSDDYIWENTPPMEYTPMDPHDPYLLRTIKHCPLCGHPYDGDIVMTAYRPDPNSGITWFRIRCIPCGLFIEQDRKDKAIGMWNNRSPEVKAPEDINIT